ncbi:hypothetical protein M3148_09540 [Georgenia satyanarayanai]|uniref:hypothetical protein n=1 Tax=Georgenia satyanarayanai TaxID=860221 RepID=UPI00203B03A4|nr:hypothetical protein [Georgenia satyanarayanai]MCM3661231.1 hypothetical protein [Georgenia satyanarayanai]
MDGAHDVLPEDLDPDTLCSVAAGSSAAPCGRMSEDIAPTTLPSTVVGRLSSHSSISASLGPAPAQLVASPPSRTRAAARTVVRLPIPPR